MNKDNHLIFEAFANRGVNILRKEENAGNKPEGKLKLKYDYEVATAYLPRDIDISNKAGQDKVLSLAFDEVLKRLVYDRKNPQLAARNMFYDEDFPMEVVSQYAHYQEHGFPEVEEHDFRDQMPDSREEYSAHDYAKEMEMRGEDAEESKHPLGDVREVPARDLKPGDVLSLFKNTVIKIDDMAPRLIKGKVRVTYKDVRGVVHNVDWNKSTKITVDNVPQEDGEEGDLMKHMKDKGMIDPKATDDTGKYGRTKEEEEHCANEDEQRRLDPACWKGYHKAGTKLKNDVRVNNCKKNS